MVRLWLISEVPATVDSRPVWGVQQTQNVTSSRRAIRPQSHARSLFGLLAQAPIRRPMHPPRLIWERVDCLTSAPMEQLSLIA